MNSAESLISVSVTASGWPVVQRGRSDFVSDAISPPSITSSLALFDLFQSYLMLYQKIQILKYLVQTEHTLRLLVLTWSFQNFYQKNCSY